MERRRFRALVKKALAKLPERFRQHLEHVEVVVEDWPSEELLRSLDMEPGDDSLLGFYDGVPLTDQPGDLEGGPWPVTDTIFVFQGPLEQMCATTEELVEQIRITVLHEVGHHFGLEDDQIERLGFG